MNLHSLKKMNNNDKIIFSVTKLLMDRNEHGMHSPSGWNSASLRKTNPFFFLSFYVVVVGGFYPFLIWLFRERKKKRKIRNINEPVGVSL